MQYKLRLFTPIVVTLMLLAAALCGTTYFFDIRLFYICTGVTCAVFVAALVMLRSFNKRMRMLLDEIASGIQCAMGGAYSELPTPVLTVYGDREIVWYNELCATRVFGGRELRGEDINDVFPGIDVSNTSPPEGYDVEYEGKRYTAFVVVVRMGETPASVVYMVDDGRLKYYANEYHESRPSIAFMVVDNFEELIQDYKDSERAQLMTVVEQAIEKYISSNHGFVTKIARDRFVAVIETRGVRNILADKVDLLDIVRGVVQGHRMPITLSIGMAGEASNLYESEQNARQALDMCLGRGGDQAAVKTPNGYEFYGGMSKAIEKRTKVKTRIIANALSELIESSSNILLMGHRFADLDCLGSAIGLMKTVRCMGKQVGVCIDREKNLVQPLLEKLVAGGYEPDDFLDPGAAMALIGSQALLIVLDAHVPHVLESEALYRAAKNVVVIDHHRKLVEHIDNAVIYYHEPYASSTCEMVAELVQYFPCNPSLSRLEAEALMAGIMLDTKNFMMRTGVRTFEAAAWLRRLGADTVEVRKLFASSMEAYRQKAGFISQSEIYRKCAIAASDHTFDGIKIVAPQAADELITISGVDASFIIFVYDNVVNVSGRSMGGINVQLIMEKLGGGGHHTMAAAQFPGGDIEAVRQSLIEAIDEYHAEANRQPVTAQTPPRQA